MTFVLDTSLPSTVIFASFTVSGLRTIVSFASLIVGTATVGAAPEPVSGVAAEPAGTDDPLPFGSFIVPVTFAPSVTDFGGAV